MHHTASELRDLTSWPEAISFVPFVGEAYDQGLDGAHVLLLGESHYIRGEGDSSADAGRAYTQSIFLGVDTEESFEERMSWGKFFTRLDQIVARSRSPSGSSAANAWKHMAFANFVQGTVGSSRASRPTTKLWDSGKAAFPVLLEMLKPNVILVLGKMTFDRCPNLDGERIGKLSSPSSSKPRDLWRMRYTGGAALMSWVYHPSWNMDSQETRIDIFQKLLRKAADR